MFFYSSSKHLVQTSLFAMIFFGFSLNMQGQDAVSRFFQEADQFFASVVQEGSVQYEIIHQDPQKLNGLISQVESFPLLDTDLATKKAFFINAYNLHVIRSVVDAWPTQSPKSVAGFFDKTKHNTAGIIKPLDALEKEEIFARFNDPRLHFVLVCAAKGCPVIVPFAYLPEKLEDQIETQTRIALNDPNFIRVDTDGKKVSISQIFLWYEKDFTGDGSVIDYINTYREEKIPNDFGKNYYDYDWTLNAVRQTATTGNVDGLSNVQYFTPSKLLPKRQFQLKVFNNIYTQTAFRNENREKVDLGERQTFYTGLYQFDLGVSRSQRFNVGIEANIHSVRYDSDPNSSPFAIFGGGINTLLYSRTALTYIGPRVRVSPFKNFSQFSITSTALFPLHNDLESPRFLAHNRATWLTQFFYDQLFGKFQVFSEIDFLLRFPTENESFTQDAFFRTPVTVFLSYFPDSKSTLNINMQYSPAFNGLPGNSEGVAFNLNRSFWQGGVGAKYQLTPAINLELLYTNFFTSRGEGAGQTFNFGIVFIR